MMGFDNTWLPRRLSVDSAYFSSNPTGTGQLPSDGTALPLIADLGTRGNHLSQATGINQPVFKTNIVNGQNVFRLTTSSFMTCASSSNNTYVGPLTIINILSLANLGAIQQIFGKPGSWFSSASPSNGFRFTTAGVKDYDSAASQFSLNTFLVKTERFNSNFSVDFWKNGTFLSNVTGTAGMSSASNGLILGNSNPAFAVAADVVATLIWYRALSSTEISMANNFARAMIGV